MKCSIIDNYNLITAISLVLNQLNNLIIHSDFPRNPYNSIPMLML